MICNKYILVILIISLSNCIFGQNAKISGYVKNERGNAIEFANISVLSHSIGTTSNRTGYYELSVPSEKEIEIQFSFISAVTVIKKIRLNDGQQYEMNVVLTEDITILPTAIISVESDRLFNIIRLNPAISQTIPTIGGFEDILKSLPGVSSGNELSSQYNVRGGNFDENLVYVNDIEIYRPMLVRAGQQEGLSFINSDMVASVVFSAGGFQAKYGDKMSSVLDIRYRKPTIFSGTVSAGMLGGSAHIEGVSKNHLFRHSTGVRYKTTKYLLGTLDTEGNYEPSFTDIQTYITYDYSDRLEFSFLGNFSQNTYSFIPKNRETSWGTLNEALKISMYFRGQELNRFSTLTGAFTSNFQVNSNLNLKLIASSFYTSEEETFDILGQYFLNELDRQLGSDNLGDSVSNIGVGSFLNHARNYLDGHVSSLSHLGDYSTNGHNISWGLKYSHEIFNYRLKEWNMIDSAGYSLPYSTEEVLLYFVDTAVFELATNRINAFIQNSYMLDLDKSKLGFNGGIRFNYWDFNKQFLISPRFLISLKPDWKKNYVFRFSAGLYHQPPFFKEIRRPDGSLNTEIKAQSSIHFVIGSDYEFFAWNRPFKLLTEVYYKYMYNLIPYDIDNVRIRYYGENMAHGYVVGVETKIHGEFVPGTESWISFALMQTMEDIEGDFYTVKQDNGDLDTIFPGFIPRPTDQRFSFGIYFQDYIPGNPTWQLHLNLLYGSALPFGPPNSQRYMATARMRPAYRRVDIGISKRIISDEKPLPENNPFRHFKNIWISLEVFNLLDISNKISHTWVTDIRGWQYAVPNYLTGRRVNLKLTAKF